jgi:Transposase DDE domain group 1
MSTENALISVHPTGEQPAVETSGAAPPLLDSFAGPVRVEWDQSGAVTALGQAPFFIDFLKVSGCFDAWVKDCPLSYRSGNASAVRDVLGTVLLAIVAGHKRYAHITALRTDGVLPELLGMKKVVSEDAVRRALLAINEEKGIEWLQTHMDKCLLPLLSEPYIIDIDTTVKPLYGHQEGAVVGYNPKKPGRPSHVYHTYIMAGLRLVMSVETAAGNESSGAHATPGLFRMLDERIPRDHWPKLLRGDSGIASENVMGEAEQRSVDYLFKLRQTKNVKRLIARTLSQGGWANAGQGWQGRHGEVRLDGWSRQRRVVILRRLLKGDLVAVHELGKQLQLGFAEIEGDTQVYEYQVLVTSLEEEVLSIAQLYRDRADCENVFDELKNQWGWGGFTTSDLARCRLAAGMVALIYNWWNIFVRLADPDKHLEAISSRPLLLAGIAERTRHARQTTLRVTTSHGRAPWIQGVLGGVARFIRNLQSAAEQLSRDEIWSRILSHAMRSWLKGRQLRPPPRLVAPA